MMSSVRPLTRPLLLITALVLLIGLLIQPAAPSHAQEGPPPTSTATTGPSVHEQAPGERVGVAPINSDGTMSLPPAEVPAGMPTRPPQKPMPAGPALPVSVAPTSTSSFAAPVQVAPQATQPPGTFQVNIVAKATARA